MKLYTYEIEVVKKLQKLYTAETGSSTFTRIMETVYDYRIGEIIHPVEFEYYANDGTIIRFPFKVKKLIASRTKRKGQCNDRIFGSS